MKQILIAAAAPQQSNPLDSDVVRCAARRLASAGPCAYYLKDVTCHFCRGILTLEGRVPSSRLKATLRSLLLDVEGVHSLVDQVDVVSSHGLSSVHNSAE